MNTWTDSGMSEAGLVGAMLALGLDAAPRRAIAAARDAVLARDRAPEFGARVPVDVGVRSFGSDGAAGAVGRGRFPAPERSALRTPSTFPPPPMPEPKLASDDLSGWTDGFLAGGSPLPAPASWDEPSSPAPSAPGDPSALLPAELTSMLDRLLDPGRAPGLRPPAVPALLDSGPAHLGTGPSGFGPRESSHAPTPETSSAGPVVEPTDIGSGPLDGPLDVAELEPAQLDFELAPLDPESLEPTLLEPPPPGADRPAEEPSLAELAGLDRPGLGPVVLGALGLESMDLDASAFAASAEFPPPTEPAVADVPVSKPASEPVDRTEPESAIRDVPGGAHRRTDAAAEAGRTSGGAHHRRTDEMSPLSSLDDSPLYSTLSPRRD